MSARICRHGCTADPILSLTPLRRAVLAAGVLAALPAAADSWHGTLTLASDDIVRGYSRSGGKPAVLADLHWLADTGWSASFGVSTPALRYLGGKAAYTLAAGRGWQLDADWALQLAATHYGYHGTAAARAQRYAELGVRAGWRGRGTAALTWSPNIAADVHGEARKLPALVLDLGWHERLIGRLALHAGLGTQQLQGTRDHVYGSLGLGWGVGPVQLHLSVIGTDAARPREHWVAAALWSF